MADGMQLQIKKIMRRWPTPKSRDFAELSDPILFSEVLEIAHKEGYVTQNKLLSESEGLRQRLTKLWIIEKPKPTAIRGLLSAMTNFGWLIEKKNGQYSLTDSGISVQKLLKDERLFRRELASKMQERYVIPGWIISRLYSLNPKGQGEIVLPAPSKEWKPSPVRWEKSEWNIELSSLAIDAANKAKNMFPNSFPIEDRYWILAVKNKWEKIGSWTRKKVSKVPRVRSNTEEKPKILFFTPRERLTQAMREAAVELLFSQFSNTSQYSTGSKDILTNKHPLPPRSFRAWCPRLDDLELIFYTDSHPSVSGRLIFPCCAFKEGSPDSSFERISGIMDPQGNALYLFQPKWIDIREQFLNTLIETYTRSTKKIGALYVSLLDIRDEVCRQLRLSSTKFDEILEQAYRESISGCIVRNERISVSLESDVRHEQTSGYGLLRRPVYISKIPHSLIAISFRHI